MGKLSKMFQRKGDENASDASAKQAAAQQASKVSASPAAQDSGDTAFGLQFALDSGQVKVFTQLPISIGRGDQNDIVLKSDTVSTQHARVYYDELVSDICIVDLDSLNGLFINDQPTRRNILHDGVRIRLGNAVMTFQDTGYIHAGSQ